MTSSRQRTAAQDWTAAKTYDVIGGLLAAKEKQREELGQSIPLCDFVAEYFELVYASQLLAQKRVGDFARAVQEHCNDREFGPRIYVFGVLCGLIVFDDDILGYDGEGKDERVGKV